MEQKKDYLTKLVDSAKNTNSIVCMGLDPVIEAMPDNFISGDDGHPFIVHFFSEIFLEMKRQNVLPGAFKPNQGFYLKFDKPREKNFTGSIGLSNLLDVVDGMFPEIPIILDFKRGDIAKSSQNYAEEGFDRWNADAVTISPYMGTDSITPFTRYCNNEHGKGVYILNRTSNLGAKDFQDCFVSSGPGANYGMPLYEIVANCIANSWSKDCPGVGAVVGATSLAELETLAKFYAGKNIPLLIPGVGKKSVGGQGGDASEVVQKLRDSGYDLNLARINSSSGLTHPWKETKSCPKDFAKVCVEALYNLNQQINFKP
jgi:orotidine-5'-phosphate decarboxylase